MGQVRNNAQDWSLSANENTSDDGIVAPNMSVQQTPEELASRRESRGLGAAWMRRRKRDRRSNDLVVMSCGGSVPKS